MTKLSPRTLSRSRRRGKGRPGQRARSGGRPWLQAAGLDLRLPGKRGKPTASRRYRRGFPPLVRQIALALVGLVLTWQLLTALGHGQRGSRSALPVPATGTPLPVTVDGRPSLDAARVNGILAAYGSPLQGQGQAVVALSARYNVDDAVALAFFVMESRAGTQGEAVLTHSFGNLRPMPNAPSVDGYRQYDSWLDGAAEWFQLIRSLYLDSLKLDTVEAIVPVYAPASDYNDPPAMVAGIHQLVACWRGDAAVCPDAPAAVRALVAG